jgi:hypothetical protein
MTMKGDYTRKDEDQEKTRIDQARREALQKLLNEKSSEAGWEEVKAVWVSADEKVKIGGDEKVLGTPLTEMKRWLNYSDQGRLDHRPSWVCARSR